MVLSKSYNNIKIVNNNSSEIINTFELKNIKKINIKSFNKYNKFYKNNLSLNLCN